MAFLAVVILILIGIFILSYKRLKSFDKKIIKVAIVLILLIITLSMQIGLTIYGIINNENLVGGGAFLVFLILIVPATILITEAIVMPLYCRFINRYNEGKLTKTKFILYTIITILINDIMILLLYWR